MMVYDNVEDIEKYAIFKRNVDGTYSTSETGEDFNMKIGQTTPHCFPSKCLN